MSATEVSIDVDGRPTPAGCGDKIIAMSSRGTYGFMDALDARAYELRQQGLTFQAIADRLGVNPAMARRRVIRPRTLREAGKPAKRPQSSRQ